MRKIAIETWKVRAPEYDQAGKQTGKTKEMEENLITILETLLMLKKPEDMPRGLDEFRLKGRLAKAFDSAKEKGELVLEETDYSFLKKTIEKDIPSNWGLSENIQKAVETFLETDEE